MVFPFQKVVHIENGMVIMIFCVNWFQDGKMKKKKFKQRNWIFFQKDTGHI